MGEGNQASCTGLSQNWALGKMGAEPCPRATIPGKQPQ